MSHNIVLIDDNFAIRQIIKIFFARLEKRYTLDINIFSTDNGVEGLGYVYITTPKIVIVDTTLPKYSGREVLDFFIHNTKFQSRETKVIVLHEGEGHDLNLPGNFSIINKNDQRFFKHLADLVFNALNISDPTHSQKLFNKLALFVLQNSNEDDLINKSITRQGLIKRLLLRLKWTWLELTTSLILTLIILIYGRADDENIIQKDFDKKAFRTKYYPTLIVSLVSFSIIFVNLGLFFSTQLSLFRDQQIHSKASTTFIVDSTADTSDFSTADDLCDTDDSVGDGPCTLRAAIEQANVTAGADTINFNIPGAGVHTLTPATHYPAITNSLTIDGTSQPGTDCSTNTLMIELDGSGMGTNGLEVTGDIPISVTIQGLVIQNFNGPAIVLSGEPESTAEITCNIIGLDSDGVTIHSNIDGILVADNFFATIGGTTTADRNIISGNTNHGVQVQEFTNGRAIITGNYIGTDKTGLLDKGNGIGIATSHNMNGMIIGGANAGDRNVISGNTTGISVNSSGLTMQGNYIGPGADGSTGIGNSTGIIINDNSSGLDIDSNVISFNNSGISAFADGQYSLVNIHITDNLIGTDSTGDNPAGNNVGISISLPSPEDPDMQGPLSGLEITGNTISDNNNVGLVISDYSFSYYEYTESIIENNRIGLKKNSDAALGNAIGISIGGHVPIGSLNNGNLIKYNTSVGIIAANAAGTSVVGNTLESNAIGLIFEATPSSSIMNNSFTDNATGMIIRDSSHQNRIDSNTFCSFDGGELDVLNSNDNIFTNNKFGSTNDTSLEITGTSTGNSIVNNAFAISAEIPIDLGDNGQTVNDAGDTDTGPNNLQNYPENISLTSEGDLEFDLDTAAGTYLIEMHILDDAECSELESLVCSAEVIHAGGSQTHTIDCPGLPTGEFAIKALAAKEVAPDAYGDTSELSNAYTLNNSSPTNTPTPTPSNTPVPLTPSSTPTPVPINTNTPVPAASNTPIPTATIVSSLPTTQGVVSITPTSSADVTPTPSSGYSSTDVTSTPIQTPIHTPTYTPITTGIPDMPTTGSYTAPKESLVNLPEVKTAMVSFARKLENVKKTSRVGGTLIDGAFEIHERIKPLADDVSYLLSLQYIGTQTAMVGITSINLLAISAPAIVAGFSQPRILYYAMAWLWRRKNKQPWGIVSDKTTNSPVAFARVILTKDGETVSTQTTDLEGKYGFIVDKGKYQIFITHSDYIDFTKDIQVNYDGEILSTDIEVLPKSHDEFSSSLRWAMYNVRKFIKRNLFILNTIFFSTGFVYSMFTVVNALTVFNYAILSLYLLQIILVIVFHLMRNRDWGQVFDVTTGQPIAGAIIRIYNDDRQLDVTISDKQGRYSFILDPGTYYIKVSAPGFLFPPANATNTVVNSMGEKLLKFTVQDTQRLNMKLYMQGFANLQVNRETILSPFA